MGESTESDTSFYLKPVSDSSLVDRYKNSCRFMDTLLRRHKMKNLFSTDITLFPPDIEATIKEELKNIQDIPPMKALEETRQKIRLDLEELSKELDSILYGCTSCVTPDQTTVENYCRKLDLSLKTFSQMIDNFLCYYDSDIRPWCMKQDEPVLLDFGVGVKSVSNMSSQPLSLLKSISSYNNTSSYLCDEIKEELNQFVPSSSNEIDRETCFVLQNSISRKHS